jgi:hypothetical protein
MNFTIEVDSKDNTSKKIKYSNFSKEPERSSSHSNHSKAEKKKRIKRNLNVKLRNFIKSLTQSFTCLYYSP